MMRVHHKIWLQFQTLFNSTFVNFSQSEVHGTKNEINHDRKKVRYKTSSTLQFVLHLSFFTQNCFRCINFLQHHIMSIGGVHASCVKRSKQSYFHGFIILRCHTPNTRALFIERRIVFSSLTRKNVVSLRKVRHCLQNIFTVFVSFFSSDNTMYTR